MRQTKGRLTRDGATVRRVQVMLDDATIEWARVLGDGNLSQGIRQAVASLPAPTKQDERGMMAAQGKGEKEMSKKLDSVLSNAEAMQYNHVVDDYGVIVWLGPNGAIGRNMDFFDLNATQA